MFCLTLAMLAKRVRPGLLVRVFCRPLVKPKNLSMFFSDGPSDLAGRVGLFLVQDRSADPI